MERFGQHDAPGFQPGQFLGEIDFHERFYDSDFRGREPDVHESLDLLADDIFGFFQGDPVGGGDFDDQGVGLDVIGIFVTDRDI